MYSKQNCWTFVVEPNAPCEHLVPLLIQSIQHSEDFILWDMINRYQSSCEKSSGSWFLGVFPLGHLASLPVQMEFHQWHLLAEVYILTHILKTLISDWVKFHGELLEVSGVLSVYEILNGLFRNLRFFAFVTSGLSSLKNTHRKKSTHGDYIWLRWYISLLFSCRLLFAVANESLIYRQLARVIVLF